jgi:DUF1009 family protein
MSLALIAGQGGLPVHLVVALNKAQTPVQICTLEGYPLDWTAPHSPLEFCIEQLGSFLARLQDLGVSEVCFAGAIGRPKIDPARIDAATMPLVPRMMQALQAGDDAALRLVLDIFQEVGFAVRAAHDIAPDLLPDAGYLTSHIPSEQNQIDTFRAVQAHIALSLADIGQACVASHGQITAVEAMAGTDWMLHSLIQGNPATKMLPTGINDPVYWALDSAVDWLSGDPVVQDTFQFPKGGVLFKAPKKDQDRRIDLPTIGPRTVMGAAEAGLDGIVIEANGVIVLDLAQVVTLANAQGMFIWVREASA